MSPIGVTGPLSARIFLLGATGADTAEVLADSLRECGVARSLIRSLHSLSVSALQVVHHEVAAVTDRLLEELDLGNVLLSGWRKYTDLTKAAERTLADPGSEAVVVLTTHRVVSTHNPTVDLIVNGVKVHTFVFELTVEFDLEGVVAVVQRGDLVTLRCGECVVTATLTLEGTSLKRSRQGRIDLALAVRLDPPISLAHHPGSHQAAGFGSAP